MRQRRPPALCELTPIAKHHVQRSPEERQAFFVTEARVKGAQKSFGKSTSPAPPTPCPRVIKRELPVVQERRDVVRYVILVVDMHVESHEGISVDEQVVGFKVSVQPASFDR